MRSACSLVRGTKSTIAGKEKKNMKTEEMLGITDTDSSRRLNSK